MKTANATLFANLANSDVVIVELDGIAKQTDGAPQGRVYAHRDDIATVDVLSYSVKLGADLPRGTGSLDEIVAQRDPCDVLRCHLDVATMTASLDSDMNEDDTAYDFRNFSDEV